MLGVALNENARSPLNPTLPAWTREDLQSAGQGLQSGLRQGIVDAIVCGRLGSGQQLPASRLLAKQLGMARNTVTAVYEELTTRGVLKSVERRGFFVNPDQSQWVVDDRPDAEPPAPAPAVDWASRVAVRPKEWRHITKPADWKNLPYPFLYGQVDPVIFPLQAWRQASRETMARASVNLWAPDNAVDDDPVLVEQICRNVLPRRGVMARPDEVLVTLGAQEGLYLLSKLVVRPGDVIGVEEPGYTDARHIFSMSAGVVRPLPVDDEGARTGPAFEGVNLAVVTPGRQCPTGVVLSAERRRWLLDWAGRTDGLIIEDDYEGELAADVSEPALKSADRAGRVIYLGTFSKVLAPGMRLGYLVGPRDLIVQARALRRLIHRTPPLNNQRMAANFMIEGNYRGLVKRLRCAMRDRYAAGKAAIRRYMPEVELVDGIDGSALWIRCPAGVCERTLEHEARRRGVVFESGDPFFSEPQKRVHLRLGLSVIATDRVEAGVELLAEAMRASTSISAAPLACARR